MEEEKKAAATREGWLTKKGQKRYFVLSNHTLSWKTHPLSANVKKSIDILKYDFAYGEAQSSALIVVKPSLLDSSSTTHKQYELEARDWQEAHDWLTCLRAAANLHNTQEPTHSTKDGWLEKKGKRRWFLLHTDKVLYWFARSLDPSSDFTKHIKGQLAAADISHIAPVATGTLNTQRPAFRITTTTTSEYVLTASTWSEMVDWMNALHACGRQPASKPFQITSGYLMNKGKRRFFALEAVPPFGKFHLRWYTSDKAPNALNGICLEGCSVMESVDQKHSIIVVTSNGKQYELHAKSSQEAQDWIGDITESINQSTRHPSNENLAAFKKNNKIAKQGWLMKKGQRRYFIFSGDTLMWFVDEPATNEGSEWIREMKGSLTLGPGSNLLTNPRNNVLSFCIETAQGHSYTLTAAAAREAEEWVDVLRARLSQHQRLDTSAAAATTTKESSMDSTRSSGGFVSAAPSDWKPTKKTSQLSIKPFSQPAAASQPATPFAEPVVVQAGWLTKKGKRRWFSLLTGEMLWYEKEPVSVMEAKPKGSVCLAGCSIQVIDTVSFIIFSPWGQSYTLTAASPKQREIWVSCINLCIQKANLMEDKLAGTGRSKTGWMEMKGKRWWFALLERDLLWFNSPRPRYGVSVNLAKGHVNLAGCIVERGSASNVVLLKVNQGGEQGKVLLTLVAASPQDADEWISALNI